MLSDNYWRWRSIRYVVALGAVAASLVMLYTEDSSAIWRVMGALGLALLVALLVVGFVRLGVDLLVLAGIFFIGLDNRLSRARSPLPTNPEPMYLQFRNAKTAGELEDLLRQQVYLKRNQTWQQVVEASRSLRDDPGLESPTGLWEPEIVKRFITLGIDASALAAAMQLGSRKAVEELIAAGIDVNRRTATGESPLYLAFAWGYWDMARLLIGHGADVRALKSGCNPGPEESVALLFDMGEGARARELCEAATGVDPSQPDPELLQRARDLDSLFAAFAERFHLQGDDLRARRLCEWKIEGWKTGVFLLHDASRFQMQMSVCLRTLARIREAEGQTQEALRICKKALRIWKYQDDDHDMELATLILDEEVHARYLFTDDWLQFIPTGVSTGWRTEFSTLLRDCGRILGELGMAEEQRSVTATLEWLDRVRPS